MKRRALTALLAGLVMAGGAVGGTASGGSAAPAATDAVGPQALAAAAGAVACDGDGTSGKRVQILYVRETSQTDRLAQFQGTFQQWATQIDQDFIDGAADTGGYRRVRWVHDAACVPTVTTAVVANGTLSNFNSTVTALTSAGYDSTNRKYLVYAETTAWCGLGGGGSGANDDRPGSENRYNAGPDFATVGSGCWGWAPSAHELLHTLGAVLPGAPHATSSGHCWDDEDIMCYDDGGIPNPPGALVKVCAGAPENQIDCNHDDYYSTQPAAGSWLASHWNVANSQFLMTTPNDPSKFVPLATPTGALNTRNGIGGVTGARGPASTTTFPVLGVGGVPSSGVAAVLVRVGVNDATAATFLEVWPDGQARSGLSMINVAAGENISNVAVVPVGASGKLNVYNSAGNANILVDVQGYYATGSGDGFVPVAHTRLIDTRSGLGTTTGTIAAGGSRTVTLTGGVVPAGASSAFVDLIVPGATAGGWLAAAPAGTSSGLGILNYVTGATQSGAVVQLAVAGQVTFFNKGSTAINLVVIAEGYSASPSVGAVFHPAATRVINTRTTGSGTPLAAGATLDVQVAGFNAVPAGVVAAVLNVTVTPQVSGYLKAWPVGVAEPTVSIMDYNAGDWRANGLVLEPGTGGKIRIKNGSTGTMHVIVDLQGWYTN
jgi:hypothetical protein